MVCEPLPAEFRRKVDAGRLVTLAEDGKLYVVGRQGQHDQGRGYRLEWENRKRSAKPPRGRERPRSPSPGRGGSATALSGCGRTWFGAIQARNCRQPCALGPKYCFQKFIEFRESSSHDFTG